jgi:hypothetical protein
MQSQIMTHSERYGGDAILPAHCHSEEIQFDVENAYYGLPSDKMLSKRSNLMSCHIKPRLLKHLDQEEEDELRSDKVLVKLKGEYSDTH